MNTTWIIGNSKNKWDVTLSGDVPIDLRDLDIDMGVGELTIDLTGELKENLKVNIDGGIGSATIYLSEDK